MPQNGNRADVGQLSRSGRRPPFFRIATVPQYGTPRAIKWTARFSAPVPFYISVFPGRASTEA
jgi:hypothetical protein